jgi:hypothetical protein
MNPSNQLTAVYIILQLRKSVWISRLFSFPVRKYIQPEDEHRQNPVFDGCIFFGFYSGTVFYLLYPAGPICFIQGPATVEVRFAPDPRLVRAAHLRFYRMDPTEVPLSGNAAKKRADRDVIAGIGITHLKRENVPEVFGSKIGAVYRSVLFPECDKPAQDIGPALLDPDIDIRYGWCNSRAKDPAAEPALLAGVIFRYAFIHRFPFPVHRILWSSCPADLPLHKTRGVVHNTFACFF